MKISRKTRDELYRAIHHSITDIRIELKLEPKDDIKVAQLEHFIWAKQKQVLKLEDVMFK